MLKKFIILVMAAVMLLLYPDGRVYAKKFESRYKADRPQGYYNIDENEELVVWDDTLKVVRKKFGLLAAGVKNIKIEGDTLLLVGKDKKNTVYHVDLLKKTKDKKICYKAYKVTDRAKEIYPVDETAMFYRNKKDEICYTGVGTCHLMFPHKSAKTCKKESERQIRDRVVLKDVTKCWSGNNMFAYVKDNNLYITGWALMFDTTDGKRSRECCRRENVRCFFEGKGDQVSQVVCGNDRDYMIFVLLKDGSVWGIGDNSRRLITDTDTKTHMEFVKAGVEGVKQMQVKDNNVVFLKKDNTLWVRGRGFRKNEKLSYRLRKIDTDVKEMCVPRNRILYVKKDGVAYGMGESKAVSFEFTDRYSKPYKNVWINKPVKLMKNVKHVYGSNEKTILMTKDNKLYWTGEQGITYPYWW